MKVLLICIFLVFTIASNAANHTVAASGGTFTTIAQVNAHTFVAGDSILFKRGETFTGTLRIKQSGSAGNPIVFGAYGTGNNPIISGFVALTSWTDLGGGIFQKSATECSSDLNMVTLDGIPQALGRYPNAGTFLSYESVNGSTSITDNQLTGSPNWNGAEVVFRPQYWYWVKHPITNHTNGTLTYSGGNGTPGVYQGYFIQKDVRTLDQLGEWYFDGTDIKMYFGADNPTNHIIKVSTLDTLVVINDKDYITFDNITFEGANITAFSLINNKYTTIKNCNILYSGGEGISTSIGAEYATHLTVDNCDINYCLSNGLELGFFCTNNTIKNNTIRNIGTLVGMQASGAHCVAIRNYGADGIIEYNNIDTVGYNGIYLAGTNSIARYNVVNYFCFVADDGGGIYTSDWEAMPGKKVNYNIISNGIGAKNGRTDPDEEFAVGIYFDEGTANTEMLNNTVYNIAGSGYYLHQCNDITMRGNTSYNAKYHQLNVGLLSTDDNVIVRSNIFFSKESSQNCLKYQNDNSFTYYFTADSNYYARPIDDNTSLLTMNWTTDTWPGVYRTLAGWQTLSGVDAHSNKSAQSVSDTSEFTFLYNSTTSARDYVLTGTLKDVAGVSYSGTITLQPFTSLVLMEPNSPIPPIGQGKIVKYNGKIVKHNGSIIKF